MPEEAIIFSRRKRDLAFIRWVTVLNYFSPPILCLGRLSDVHGNGKGDCMANHSCDNEKGHKGEPALPSEVGEINVETVEPLQFSAHESRLLGELWDWQRQAARSDYTFTDRPPCV